ncbi:hypothetical protein Bca52824_071370 [Brassica carinata]|uniref:Phosphate transporter n=1 Tax=Brassica carinata TaxID=52824 RepID=A0A8X7U5Y9_BRACI|nr:hypothetical protein Bca52824_071370 [Brassica carinata]
MQVLSACFMSFAHGGDVSNAIGPLAAALSILNEEQAPEEEEIVIPIDVLAWGGSGSSRAHDVGIQSDRDDREEDHRAYANEGFAAEFAAATVVLFASKLGLPISATHTLVGAVMGVGFARGLNSVRAETVKEIVASWLVTIPVGLHSL